MTRKFQIFLVICLIGCSQLNASDFKWDGDNDTVATALSLSALTHLMFSQYGETDSIKLDQLDYNINSFDKTAIDNWSPNASRISDVLLFTELSAPLLLCLDKNSDNNKTYSLLYLQSIALNNLITHSAKMLVKRKRPYVYNQELSNEIRKNRESTFSFFSGHTSNTFMAAAFMIKVIEEDNLYTHYQSVIYPALILGAGSTAWLRYHSGKHFPTDIITGAIIGTACGLIVPELHKKEKDQENRQIINLSWKF